MIWTAWLEYSAAVNMRSRAQRPLLRLLPQRHPAAFLNRNPIPEYASSTTSAKKINETFYLNLNFTLGRYHKMVLTRSKANAAPLEAIKVETNVPAVRSALGDVTNVNRSPTDKNGFGLPVPVAGKKGNHPSRPCALLKRRGHYIVGVSACSARRSAAREAEQPGKRRPARTHSLR